MNKQPGRVEGSQAAFTFKYATLRTGKTNDTVTLKKQDDSQTRYSQMYT